MARKKSREIVRKRREIRELKVERLGRKKRRETISGGLLSAEQQTRPEVPRNETEFACYDLVVVVLPSVGAQALDWGSFLGCATNKKKRHSITV